MTLDKNIFYLFQASFSMHLFFAISDCKAVTSRRTAVDGLYIVWSVNWSADTKSMPYALVRHHTKSKHRNHSSEWSAVHFSIFFFAGKVHPPLWCGITLAEHNRARSTHTHKLTDCPRAAAWVTVPRNRPGLWRENL